MEDRYVDFRNGGYYVAGTRVSLDSVVMAFQRGDSPESILVNFPAIERLGRVYGAIGYYLDHQALIDRYLDEGERELEAELVRATTVGNVVLRERLAGAIERGR
jgi:uncharacterized protein (DUF433 family)